MPPKSKTPRKKDKEAEKQSSVEEVSLYYQNISSLCTYTIVHQLAGSKGCGES